MTNIPWPPPWKYKKSYKTLAFAADESIQTEHHESFSYTTKTELDDLLFAQNLYVLMPDFELWKHVQEYVDGGDECIWADAAKRIIGFKVRRGRKVRYIYSAKAAWPGMETLGASGLPRLRAFLDSWDVGDLSTPGAVGLRVAEVLIPRNERFWRPSWAAWHDLHEHGVAGWVDLFLKHKSPDSEEATIALDMNAAYPSAARFGMPAGRCGPIYDDIDAEKEAWTFGRYEWRLSSDPDVVEQAKYAVLAIGRHDNDGAKCNWIPQPGASGDGWYTGVEAQLARDSGAFDQFEFKGGWGWEKVSSAFLEWTNRIELAKTHYKALGPDYEIELGWVKRMSVAPFGRFFMDARTAHVYSVESKAAVEKHPYVFERPIWVQQYGNHTVEFQLLKQPALRPDPTKLPQLAVHVWTQTRVKLAQTMAMAHEAGWEIYMCAIDGIYAKPVSRSMLDLQYGHGMGQWKQKELFDVDISAAGTVKGRTAEGEKFVKMPGIPMSDKRRK